jgi:hypothetical protein
VSKAHFVGNGLVGSENLVSVGNVESVNLTRLRLDAKEARNALSVVHYPIVKIIGNGIYDIVNLRYVTAGLVISNYLQAL